MAGTGKSHFPFPVILGLTGAGVVLLLVLTFTMTGEAPEADTSPEALAEEQRPTGAGTKPEGQADLATDGVTDQLDEVTPAAPGEDTIPPAEMAEDAGGAEAQDRVPPESADGEAADAETDTASDPGAEGGDAASTDGDAAAADGEATEGQADTAATDGASSDGEIPTTYDENTGELPEGRDAQTTLTPEEGQDVTRDTDTGGTGFVPTPSGPEGRDDDPLTSE